MSELGGPSAVCVITSVSCVCLYRVDSTINRPGNWGIIIQTTYPRILGTRVKPGTCHKRYQWKRGHALEATVDVRLRSCIRKCKVLLLARVERAFNKLWVREVGNAWRIACINICVLWVREWLCVVRGSVYCLRLMSFASAPEHYSHIKVNRRIAVRSNRTSGTNAWACYFFHSTD